jgi:hypothetical protein
MRPRETFSRNTMAPRDKADITHVLVSFGTRILSEVSDPAVIAVFRLAIAEAVNAPEVAQALDSIAIKAGRAALRDILAQAQSSGLLNGQPAEMAERFTGLLWGSREGHARQRQLS